MPQQNPLWIDAGSLRHKIQIQVASTTGDAAGEPISTWGVVLNTRASIESTGSLSYKMSFANNALATQSTDLITIRWPGASITIKPGMRVVFGDNIYLVQAVNNVQHRNYKVLLACMMIDEDSN